MPNLRSAPWLAIDRYSIVLDSSGQPRPVPSHVPDPRAVFVMLEPTESEAFINLLSAFPELEIIDDHFP